MIRVVITCRLVESAVAWFRRVLGREGEEFGPQRRTSRRFGGRKINLRPVSAKQEEWFTGAAGGVPGTDDLCFVVTMKSDQVAEYLRACGVAVEVGPVA